MPPSATPKSRNSLDKLTDNFSSGQLVIGIVVALFLMLTSFVMGYVVANIDPAMENVEGTDARQQVAQAPESPSERTRTETTAAPKTETSPQTSSSSTRPTTNPGSSTSSNDRPRLVTLPPLDPKAKEQAPPASSTPPDSTRASDTQPPKDVQPAVSEKPPASPATTSEAPSAGGKAPSDPGSSTESAAPTPTPAEPAVAKPAGAGAPPDRTTARTGSAANAPSTPKVPDIQPLDDAALLPTTERTPSVDGAAKGKGKFGIQVGALFGPDRAARAAQRKAELKSKEGLDVEVVPSADGKADRLIVTGFADRRAAEAACKELRNRPEFGDAWVVSL